MKHIQTRTSSPLTNLSTMSSALTDFITPLAVLAWENHAKTTLYPRTYKSYKEEDRVNSFAKDTARKYGKTYDTFMNARRMHDWSRYASNVYASEYATFAQEGTRLTMDINFGKSMASKHREDYLRFAEVWCETQETQWVARLKKRKEDRIEREVSKRLAEIAFEEEVERRVAQRLAAKEGATAAAESDGPAIAH